MPIDRSQSRKPSRHRKLTLSIRARLIVLALFCIAPLMFERVRALETARALHIARARAEVVDLARQGAHEQEQIVSSTRALLELLAHAYAMVPVDPGKCDRYLSSFAASVAWIRMISAAGPDGQIRCSSEPQAIGLNVADRAHFQTALKSRGFALSNYLISRVNQTPSLIAAFPVIGDDGSVTGVVLAAIDLRWVNDLAATAARHAGASVLLIDGSGTLVAASADEKQFVGGRFTKTSLVRDVLAHDKGTVTTAGPDGVKRIFAYVRVPATQARLAVGLDAAGVQSGIDHAIDVAYLQLIFIGILVLLVTWFGGEQLIVRPIRSLVRTFARFGRGDLEVRATRQRWAPEFEPLAAAFDDMADKLAAREEELRIANQHLEELASLDGLTGLGNRRGFDRELGLVWQRATECGQPVALMMIDIDHFKLYNDRYGHVAGDTCLRAVGETLSLVTLKQAVVVARFGGEEFALLLPNLDLERAVGLADEARRAIEDLLIANAEAPCGLVTISIGVESVVPKIGQPAADLVEAADQALYAAKRNGRNTVVAGAPVPLSMAS